MVAIEISPMIKLVPLNLTHTEDLLSLIDKNRNFLRQHFPWVEIQKNQKQIAHFISTYDQKMKNEQGIMYGIFKQDQLIGNVGIYDIDQHNKTGQLSIWLDQEAQKKGIAKNATQQVIQFGFMNWKLNRLEIRCKSGHQDTLRFAERLGFNIEGKLRQSEWFYDRYEDLIILGLLEQEITAKMA